MKLCARTRPILIALALAAVAASAPVHAQSAVQGGLSEGPDVTIYDLRSVDRYGNGSPCPPGYNGDCRGYSLGTDSCNVGSVPVDWCDEISGCRTTTDAYHPIVATNSDHSVIAQNIYRLKDGRFEQIGLSFLKHGFVSTNFGNSACVWNDDGTPNTSCVQPPAGGDQLGVGCTDFYGSFLNGIRPMGRRSDVQVAGADHPPDPAGGQTNDEYDQRIVVAEEDLDPTLNSGALYWMEGHYVVRDDARAGNGLNNASYRPVTVGSRPNLDIAFVGTTVRETPAIFAWQAEDPQVDIVQADRLTSFLGEPADPPATGQTYPDYSVVERFHAAWRVTPAVAEGFNYHYEYAIYNMNSDTSADGFSVDFGTTANLGNAGFHDVDHHSGEPYDTSDWTIEVDGPNGKITWSAVDMGANTNALRWGTAFSFWFDSDLPPVDMIHTLDLYKIDELLNVPFVTLNPVIFKDGFESGDTSAW
jgi:hypothetical protein